jgi:26S proteasome regulatory subunit N1
MKRQLAFILARAQIPIEWLQSIPPDDEIDADADVNPQDEIPEDLRECLSNTRLCAYFREYGKELGVADPKSLEDVYKSHLENSRTCIRSSDKLIEANTL